ncbi:hypothetical protein ORQ98_26025 [Spartinivicinus sp. A2-2]|uniref:Uncharacterized protein n=1 Tax=Spartinivicinus poritis TaxID=2994640 RepID=A0ABT5UGE5_9GAMM|nr:hypothetical protein [Spartinivicinus sp. A2-2]
MITYLIDIGTVKAIEFRCLEQNKGSIKVAIRTGATHLSTIPDYICLDHTLQSLKIFQLQLIT